MAENLKFQRSRVSFSPVGTPRMSISGAGQVGQAVKGAGAELEKYAKRQQYEHDLARVLGATTIFRDSARAKMSEVLKREGKNAAGTLKDYDAWYTKERGRIAMKALENEDQRTAFREFAESKRAHDLDALAIHQAREHQRHLKAALAATITTAQQDVVMDPTNEARMQESLAQIRTNLEAVTPGLDISAEMARNEASMKVLAIKSMISTDQLGRAAHFLEKWKEDLGGAYPEVKKSVVFSIQQKEREAAITYNLEKAKREEALRKARDQWQNQAFRAFRDRQLTFEQIMASPLEPSQKEHWINKLNQQAQNMGKGNKDPFETDDPRVYAKWSEKINLSPQAIKSKSEIWKDHGKGLSTASVEKLTKMFEGTADPLNNSRKRRYHRMLGTLRGQYVFDGDVRQNELIYGRKANELDNFFIQNPKASDAEVQQFFHNLTVEEKSGFVQEILDFFKTMGVVESGEANIERPDQEPVIVQTGRTKDGRRVVKYSDGRVEYAD